MRLERGPRPFDLEADLVALQVDVPEHRGAFDLDGVVLLENERKSNRVSVSFSDDHSISGLGYSVFRMGKQVSYFEGVKHQAFVLRHQQC